MLYNYYKGLYDAKKQSLIFVFLSSLLLFTRTFSVVYSAEQEQREFEAISHVKDSVQMVENAILERDQV